MNSDQVQIHSSNLAHGAVDESLVEGLLEHFAPGKIQICPQQAANIRFLYLSHSELISEPLMIFTMTVAGGPWVNSERFSFEIPRLVIAELGTAGELSTHLPFVRELTRLAVVQWYPLVIQELSLLLHEVLGDSLWQLTHRFPAMSAKPSGGWACEQRDSYSVALKAVDFASVDSIISLWQNIEEIGSELRSLELLITDLERIVVKLNDDGKSGRKMQLLLYACRKAGAANSLLLELLRELNTAERAVALFMDPDDCTAFSYAFGALGNTARKAGALAVFAADMKNVWELVTDVMRGYGEYKVELPIVGAYQNEIALSHRLATHSGESMLVHAVQELVRVLQSLGTPGSQSKHLQVSC